MKAPLFAMPSLGLSPTLGKPSDRVYHMPWAGVMMVPRGGEMNYGVVGSSKSASWCALLIAIFIEIFATTKIKISTDRGSVIGLTCAMVLYNFSLACFSVSLVNIDLSIAYAVWSALGTALVSVAGVLLFQEKVTAAKIFSLFAITLGTIGLQIAQ